MQSKGRRVTLEDVAVEAGVSRSLASLALRGDAGVSAERRAHILKVASRMNYVPDPHARNLASNGSRTIGVIVGTIENPFISELVKAIDRAAREQGFDTLLSINGSTDEAAKAAADTFISHRCAGLVLVAAPADERHVVDIAERIPAVYIGRHSLNARVNSVSNDNHLGAKLVVDHLVGLGHRRIACIDGGDGPGAGRRREGYVAAMQAHGLTPLIVRGDYSIDAGWSGCTTLFAGAAPPTAIFAANDMTAIGVLNYLFRNGYRVPADISVVGYDDMPFSATAAIELTTVRQPVHLLASQAIFSLSESITGKKTSATHSLVVPELIVRKSTATNQTLSS